MLFDSGRGEKKVLYLSPAGGVQISTGELVRFCRLTSRILAD
jgi:hypothetical protein